MYIQNIGAPGEHNWDDYWEVKELLRTNMQKDVADKKNDSGNHHMVRNVTTYFGFSNGCEQ